MIALLLGILVCMVVFGLVFSLLTISDKLFNDPCMLFIIFSGIIIFLSISYLIGQSILRNW